MRLGLLANRWLAWGVSGMLQSWRSKIVSFMVLFFFWELSHPLSQGFHQRLSKSLILHSYTNTNYAVPGILYGGLPQDWVKGLGYSPRVCFSWSTVLRSCLVSPLPSDERTCQYNPQVLPCLPPVTEIETRLHSFDGWKLGNMVVLVTHTWCSRLSQIS